MIFRLPLYSGVILHELYLANMIIIKRKFDLGIKTKVKGIMTMLQECQQCLIQATDALANEKNTPAGEKLLNLVLNSTKEFNRWLQHNKINLNEEKHA